MDNEWIAVGNESEFQEGVRPVNANGERLLLCSIDGKLRATAAKCPHAGVPMDSAELEGTILTCPLHGWRFDLACDGAEIHGYRPLDTRPVRIEAGIVYVAARQ